MKWNRSSPPASRLVCREDKAGWRALALCSVHQCDEERGTLARRLHDQAVQRLVALQFGLDHLDQDQDPPSELALTRRAGLRKIISDLTDDLADLSNSLHSPALDHLGLLVAVSELVRRFAILWPAQVQYLADPVAPAVPIPTALVMYRCFEETLQYLQEAAVGSGISIVIKCGSERIWICVRTVSCRWDKTAQPDAQQSHQGSTKLLLVRERMRGVGGRTNFRLLPTGGLQLDLRLRV